MNETPPVDRRVAGLHKLLERGCQAAGIALTQPIIHPLVTYLMLLEKWNRVFNLTAVRALDAMVVRHLLDSLVILPYIQKTPILDVGSGAGLPGIPLSLSLPQCEFVLLDSSHKKTRFLQQVLLELAITNVEVVCSRVETFQPQKRFGTVISRAFRDAREAVAKSSHLCAEDGCWLFMKGRYREDEFNSLTQPVVVHKLNVPGLAEERHLVVVQNLGLQA